MIDMVTILSRDPVLQRAYYKEVWRLLKKQLVYKTNPNG